MVTLAISLRFWSPINPIRWPGTMFLGIHTFFALVICALKLICVQTMHKSCNALDDIAWLSELWVKLTWKHPDLLLNSSLCGQMIKVTQVTNVSLWDISFLHTMLCVCSRFTVFASSLYSRGAIINGLALSALIKFLCYVAYFLHAFMLESSS